MNLVDVPEFEVYVINFIEDEIDLFFEHINYLDHRRLKRQYRDWLYKNIGVEGFWGHDYESNLSGLVKGGWYLYVDTKTFRRALMFSSKENAERFYRVWAVHAKMSAE